MLTTFGLSMIMSNTAATAMMLAVLAPLLTSAREGDTSRALVLGVALAANLGGMASLIGTPPNAIAVGALADRPDAVVISFLDWLVIGLPPALMLLVIGWLVLRLRFRLEPDAFAGAQRSRRRWGSRRGMRTCPPWVVRHRPWW